ncbi:hypothetical protein KVV02_005138 [Mortierella alpina]|uniref:Uncharacterized protein n=1 Tax=Mortierella alpina TaxID=64518 RepID=A0A9P8CZY5_MORAP|nr:hypothetical protein KVV02_005138 [Mortierella alpina]
MPNDGSLDALPLSPCTDGSLGFGPEYLGTAPFKALDTPAADVAIERTAALGESKKDDETKSEEQDDNVNDKDEEEEKKGGEQEVKAEEIVATVANITLEDTVVEEATEACEAQQDVEEENKEGVEEEHEGEQAAEQKEVRVEQTVPVIEDFVEVAAALDVSSLFSETPSEESVAPTRAAVLKLTQKPTDEPMASGIPNRPVLSGMPTHGQTRGLSAASLALKKKQAAENAAATLKAMAVELPETDSITNRIKMFGGASPNRSLGSRKCNVRDMVQKFKDVEDRNQDVIAHVEKGHNSAEPQGVCSAYSLSTASRPLRSTPRRKMSHELNENEARQMLRSAVTRRDVDERVGVIQESVQSVRNAKSLFERMALIE